MILLIQDLNKTKLSLLREMQYKPIYVQTGSQRTLLSAQVRLTNNFHTSDCIFFLRRRCENYFTEILRTLFTDVKSIGKILAPSPFSRVCGHSDEKNGRRNEKLPGDPIARATEMSDHGRPGKSRDKQEMPVINAVQTQAAVIQKLHASKLSVLVIICYQNPLCPGSPTGMQVNIGSR